MSKTVNLRPAIQSDIDKIHFIERIAFETPWTTSMLKASLEPPYHFMVLEDDRAVLMGYAIYINLAQECQILNIAVHPELHGKGWGRYLLQSILKDVAEQGAKDAFLEVRISNQGAIHLYKSEGFKVVGMRKRYYQTRRRGEHEDALVLKREFAV